MNRDFVKEMDDGDCLSRQHSVSTCWAAGPSDGVTVTPVSVGVRPVEQMAVSDEPCRLQEHLGSDVPSVSQKKQATYEGGCLPAGWELFEAEDRVHFHPVDKTGHLN